MKPTPPEASRMGQRQLLNSLCLLAVDSLILLAALYAGKALLFWIKDIPISIRYALLIIPAWWIGAAISGQLPGWGLGAVEELRRIELLLMVVFFVAAVGSVLVPSRILPSRIVYLASYAIGAVLLPFGRIWTRRLLDRSGLWGCGVAIYGDRTTVDRIMEVLGTEVSIGYHPACIFSNDLPVGETRGGVEVLGGMNGATDRVSVAIASIGHLHENRLGGFIDQTLRGYRKIVLLPDIGEELFAWVSPRNFNGVIGLEISRNLLHPLAALGKRAFDVAAILLLAPAWVPLILLLALLVFLSDRGQPFYGQPRVGRHGRIFRACKLRTMVPDADARLERVLAADPALRAEWEGNFKLRNDPRITRIGTFLRRFSLDELPQAINILAGHMSLVGPRPLPAYHHEGLSTLAQGIRSQVRPGITGIWQVSGRSDRTVEEMEQLDSFYIRNWSVWLDAYILARTIKAVFFSHGAY